MTLNGRNTPLAEIKSSADKDGDQQEMRAVAEQKAQLPQRNSVSAAHIEGGG